MKKITAHLFILAFPLFTYATLPAQDKLWGMTSGGGANGSGVIFQYDPTTGTYIDKFDFDGTANGRRPKGSLTLASNGKFYGMTSSGGILGIGITYELGGGGALFEYYTQNNLLLDKLDFTSSTGTDSRMYLT